MPSAFLLADNFSLVNWQQMQIIIGNTEVGLGQNADAHP